MDYWNRQNRIKNRPAVTLVLTLVVLVVLTTVLCSLSARLATLKHRRQYMIDYQVSRYACDSGVKYAIARLQDIKMDLIEREGLADFTDIFTMNEEEYDEFLYQWAEEISLQMELADLEEESDNYSDSDDEGRKSRDMSQFIKQESNYNRLDNLLQSADSSLRRFDDDTEPNSNWEMFEEDEYYEEGDYYVNPDNVIVPGPYGPQWPNITEPIEFKIGESKITINIEDENAKMPLVWALTKDKKLSRPVADAIEIFGEWMQMDPCEIEDLTVQLSEIKKIKDFDINAKPIVITENVRSSRSSRSTRRPSSRSRRRTPSKATTKKTVRPATAHTFDFARLIHSSMIDLEKLAEPLPETGQRYESAMRYLGLWGSGKVNINTAPRHVLEAAFAFGGDSTEIANAIIEMRRIKPFEDIEQLKKELYSYTVEIDKAKPYIITVSTFLTIRVTAWNGKARTSSVVTVIKGKKNFEKVAIISN